MKLDELVFVYNDKKGKVIRQLSPAELIVLLFVVVFIPLLIMWELLSWLWRDIILIEKKKYYIIKSKQVGKNL